LKIGDKTLEVDGVVIGLFFGFRRCAERTSDSGRRSEYGLKVLTATQEWRADEMKRERLTRANPKS
jgi:hypothetical protein